MQTLDRISSPKNGHSSQPILNYLDVPLYSKSELIDITPEIAQAWLAMAGRGHRTIGRGKVNKITRDISSGEYLVTANAIGFDSDGRLIDGRHRLSAVVDAGLPIRSWVVFGLEPRAIDVTDDGRQRTQGDMFKMAEEHNYSHLASVVSHIWRYDQKLWAKSAMGPTKPEAKRWLAENGDVRASVNVGMRAGHVMAPTVVGAAHFLFRRIDPLLAERFCEGLITGVGLGTDDPIRRLREKMLADRTAKRKMTTAERFALVILAWNYYRQQRTITYLRWIRDGNAKQAFPVAI